MTVSVNVSLAQLQVPGAVDELAQIIRDAGPRAEQLVLEVPESTFVLDQNAAKAVGRLRALGPMVALDDFGIGAATLARLRSMPVDILRVDRILAVGLGDHGAGRALVGAMAALARKRGLHSVLEGIEDEETMVAARELGVTFGQGYYFSKPIVGEQVQPGENHRHETEWLTGLRERRRYRES